MSFVEQLGLAEAPLRYNRAVGPLYEITDEAIGMMDVVDAAGINCQLFMHWVLEELCKLTLPKDYLSSHIWAGGRFLRPVDLRRERFQYGDILLTGRAECSLPQDLHLAVMIDRTETGAAQFLHCLKLKDKSLPSIRSWTLDDFIGSKFHRHIFGVRRLVGGSTLEWHEDTNFDAENVPVQAIPYSHIQELSHRLD